MAWLPLMLRRLLGAIGMFILGTYVVRVVRSICVWSARAWSPRDGRVGTYFNFGLCKVSNLPCTVRDRELETLFTRYRLNRYVCKVKNLPCRFEVEVSQLVMSGTYLGRYPCGVRTRRVTSEDGYSMFGVRDTYFWRYLRAVADLPCDFRG